VLGPECGARLGAQWLVWRLVLAHVATLSEIEHDWSLVDLWRATLALDFQQAAERLAQKGKA
jgi:hypothetical protein